MTEPSPTLADYEAAIMTLAETLRCEPHITAVLAAASWMMRTAHDTRTISTEPLRYTPLTATPPAAAAASLA